MGELPGTVNRSVILAGVTDVKRLKSKIRDDEQHKVNSPWNIAAVWHGERYNKKGEQQLIDYLNYFSLDSGYMLSFNFNANKEVGVKEISIQNKMIVEATV